MPTHDHDANFQVRNRVLDYTSGIHIVDMHRVGNVAVHEYLAGRTLAYCCFGDAAVGAADPEGRGGLPLSKRGEEVRGVGFCVFAVEGGAMEEVGEGVCGGLVR